MAAHESLEKSLLQDYSENPGTIPGSGKAALSPLRALPLARLHRHDD